MPRREPGMPIPIPSVRPMSSSEARKIAGPQAPSLLKPNLGLPEVPTDPGLLRNPRYAELPAQAFEKGQDPEKYIQAGKAIEQQKQQAQQRQAQTPYGRALRDQSREPEPYDWQDLPDGTHRKIPAAPYAIRREDPSTVLSQNAQIARMKSALTPEQRAAQATGKAPPLFAKPATGTTPLTPQQQRDVLTRWEQGGKTPQEKQIRGTVATQARQSNFGRNPEAVPSYVRKIEAQRQADFEAWDRGEPGSVGRFGAPVRRPLENIDLYTKKEVGFEPGLADKVSSKVGFDVLSSKARTADVLRQSKTAEVAYDAAKRSAERLKKPLFREQIEPNIKFKNNKSLMESIYNILETTTTSGRQTGVGSGKTLMQPEKSWQDIAKEEAAKSRAFAGQDLSNVKFERRDGKVYANGTELTTASIKTSHYADTPSTKPAVSTPTPSMKSTTGSSESSSDEYPMPAGADPEKWKQTIEATKAEKQRASEEGRSMRGGHQPGVALDPGTSEKFGDLYGIDSKGKPFFIPGKVKSKKNQSKTSTPPTPPTPPDWSDRSDQPEPITSTSSKDKPTTLPSVDKFYPEKEMSPVPKQTVTDRLKGQMNPFKMFGDGMGFARQSEKPREVSPDVSTPNTQTVQTPRSTPDQTAQERTPRRPPPDWTIEFPGLKPQRDVRDIPLTYEGQREQEAARRQMFQTAMTNPVLGGISALSSYMARVNKAKQNKSK